MENLPTARKVALLEHADRTTRTLDKRIVQVKVVYGDLRQEIKIANSLGLFCQDERYSIVFMVQAVAAEGNLGLGQGRFPLSGFLWKRVVPSQLLRQPSG